MPALLAFSDVWYPACLDGFSCEIEAGSSAVLVVSRGEQSSALIRLITGTARPSRGSVLVDGLDVSGLDPQQLERHRRQTGVVPSGGGLISNLKLWENVTLPLLYHVGAVPPEQEQSALDHLSRLGYSGSIMALPAHLSLSEKRTAAMVRAMLPQPRLLILGDCIEAPPAASRHAFIQAAQEYHAAAADRTLLYITSAPGLAEELQAEMTVRLDRPVTASRTI